MTKTTPQLTERHDDLPLHEKYRPRTLDEVIGHENVVTSLRGYVESGKFPSAIALFGPTSAGKTTLAHSFATTVLGRSCLGARDYTEINASESRTIDDVRALIGIAKLSPTQGTRRFVMLDEAQGLVSGGGGDTAAKALLVPLERPVRTTTWILASMDPDKFSSTKTGAAIANRCVQFHLSAPSAENMTALFNRIRKGEGYTFYTRAVRDAVIDAANSEMRTLCQIMSRLAAYYSGLPESDRPDKLGEEDVAEVLKSSTDVDDVTVAKLLCAIYAGNLAEALRLIPDVQDHFQFVNKLLSTNYYLMTNAALKGQRHSKVWPSKSAKLVVSQGAVNGLGRLALPAFALMNERLVDLKRQAGQFLVPETALLAAFASGSVNAMQPVIRALKGN